MGRTKKTEDPKTAAVPEEYIVPEEGGVYKCGNGVYSSYIYLEGMYYGTYGYVSTRLSKSNGWKYIGNLKDFRPYTKKEGNFAATDYVSISTDLTGCVYSNWYKENIVSEEDKTKQAFAKFFQENGIVIPTKEVKIPWYRWLF